MYSLWNCSVYGTSPGRFGPALYPDFGEFEYDRFMHYLKWVNWQWQKDDYPFWS
jgi:hypothetical protein